MKNTDGFWVTNNNDTQTCKDCENDILIGERMVWYDYKPYCHICGIDMIGADPNKGNIKFKETKSANK